MLYQRTGCSTVPSDGPLNKVVRKLNIVLPTAFPYLLVVIPLAVLASAILIRVHLNVSLRRGSVLFAVWLSPKHCGTYSVALHGALKLEHTG